MDHPYLAGRQFKYRIVVCLAFIGLIAQALSAQHLYVGNDNPLGGLREYNMPISASSTPNFTIAGNNVVAIAVDANGNLAAGDFAGNLTFFTVPLSGASLPAASFKNGGGTNDGQIAFTPAGDFFAATVSTFGVNKFTRPFSNASIPSQTIANGAMTQPVGVALDAAQNLYISNTNGGGGNLFVYAPPYNGVPIITQAVGGTAYRKIALNATQLFVTSIIGTTGRVDVYPLPITAVSTPAFSITAGVNLPEALAFDLAGNLHVGNLSNATVTVFNPPFSASSAPVTTLVVSTTAYAIFGIAIGNSAVQGGAVLPAVASTAGSGGSFFRTGVQLHNDGASAINGRFVFHRAGVAGNDSDPSASYTLNPGETQSIADLVQATGQSGLGSADVIPTAGPLPTVVTRVFNDAGTLGTAGFTEDLVKVTNALGAGDQFTLLVPPDLSRSRYNIGVRTLGAGASITVTQRNGAGTVVNTVSKTYGPTFFEQTGAAAFLGMNPSANDSLTVTVNSGSLFIYGATTDNTTQDPSVQLGRK